MNNGGERLVRSAMDDAPPTCTTETELDEVRCMMLKKTPRSAYACLQAHAHGVISFAMCQGGWWTAKTFEKQDAWLAYIVTGLRRAKQEPNLSTWASEWVIKRCLR